MKLDATSEARLQAVNPMLANKIRQMADILKPENIVFIVTQGLRSWMQQQVLWLKGRDPNTEKIIDPLGKGVVTKAPPGHSWHNFGLAVDLAPLAAGKIDWDPSHPVWARLIAVGESVGLVAGAHFHDIVDNPHFQLTGKFPASPNDEVRLLFKQHGMVALWEDAGLLVDSQIKNA